MLQRSLLALTVLLAWRSTSPCVNPGPAPGEWVPVGGSAFAMRLPSGFREEAVRNDEVEAGSWAMLGQRLTYEYGVRANSRAASDSLVNRVSCEARIGGHDARVVTGRDSAGQYLVAAYWEDLGRIATGTASLTLRGTARDAAGAHELLVAIWSVQY